MAEPVTDGQGGDATAVPEPKCEVGRGSAKSKPGNDLRSEKKESEKEDGLLGPHFAYEQGTERAQSAHIDSIRSQNSGVCVIFAHYPANSRRVMPRWARQQVCCRLLR